MPDAKESTTRDAGQSLDDVTLEEIVRRIVAASQPEKVVLFGSAARGEMARTAMSISSSSNSATTTGT